jgi:predicted CXXCH cytochrome family protein
MMRSRILLALLLLATIAASLAAGLGGRAWAGRISDIRNTKHNLSASGHAAGNSVYSATENEVCVFCHTPHAATQGATPLWNRTLSTATYTTYHSSSLDASPGNIGLDQPNGTSKLCLSCHDGTIALGQVNVLRGGANASITMQGTDPGGVMPSGKGGQTGYTRNLGTDLTNDHPISFTYDDANANRDGELQVPSTSPGNPRLIDSRAPGYKPKFPLDNGQMQCTTCHDPHIRDDNAAEGNIKFLRQNRFQKNQGPSTTYTSANDILCLACHTKAGWSTSAHADPAVATQTYTNAAATLREFPTNLPVWQAACLNCHDPHTVQGSRRLLRDGTNGPANGQGVRSGGSPAMEETCYACHSPSGNANGVSLTNQGSGTFAVPNVQTDFLSTYHMPIADQPEVHDIGNAPGISQPGKDGIESQTLLAQRHTECTDCHNPHRTMKNRLAVGTGASVSATHDHKSTTQHSNLASGALRGAWGVEPTYGSATFGSLATSFTVKRGDPGASITMAVTDSYVTREYQICLKCHSSYAYGAAPPLLGYSGGTPSGTNGITQYTDIAMEIQAPTADQGEVTGTGGVANNHRSWHPVMNSTGRTAAVRGANANNWLSPWNGANFMGNQTMYCSDCHGSTTAAPTGTTGTVIPNGNANPQTDVAASENGSPWGPHGSSSIFILKGPFSRNVGKAGTGTDYVCFRCHQYNCYASGNTSSSTGCKSGFGDRWAGSSANKSDNLHMYHIGINKISVWRCTLCHVNVPHGWKNKALLVNLNNVGTEVGLAPGTQVRNGTTAGYDKAPYYNGAVLKVKTWGQSSKWDVGYCGSSGAPGNGQTGKTWMESSNENCLNVP